MREGRKGGKNEKEVKIETCWRWKKRKIEPEKRKEGFASNGTMRYLYVTVFA